MNHYPKKQFMIKFSVIRKHSIADINVAVVMKSYKFMETASNYITIPEQYQLTIDMNMFI